MRGLIPQFSAHRMLLEYVSKLYSPDATGAPRATVPATNGAGASASA